MNKILYLNDLYEVYTNPKKDKMSFRTFIFIRKTIKIKDRNKIIKYFYEHYFVGCMPVDIKKTIEKDLNVIAKVNRSSIFIKEK